MKRKYDVYFDDVDQYGKDKVNGDTESENHLDKMSKKLENIGTPKRVQDIFEK